MTSREPSDLESTTAGTQGRGRHEFSTLSALSAPVTAAQLGMMTMGVIDTMMVVRVGTEALAAIALASTRAWSSWSPGPRARTTSPSWSCGSRSNSPGARAA